MKGFKNCKDNQQNDHYLAKIILNKMRIFFLHANNNNMSLKLNKIPKKCHVLQ